MVVKPDGKQVRLFPQRGQIFVCADGCCCGRTDDGRPPVPRGTFHDEWERRQLRHHVQLTIGGCLGPCALSNVVMVLFAGRSTWFQAIDHADLAVAIMDHVEAMLAADAYLPPPPTLGRHAFDVYDWEARKEVPGEGDQAAAC